MCQGPTVATVVSAERLLEVKQQLSEVKPSPPPHTTIVASVEAMLGCWDGCLMVFDGV